MAETLGLVAMAARYTREIVERPAVKQKLQASHGRNWVHRLLRTDRSSRTLEEVAVEMCELALATANDYELRRYQVFCGIVADLIAELRLRGELPRQSLRARRIRELELEHAAQVALERARETQSPAALRAFAEAEERDAANDLAEATAARLEAEIAEGTRVLALARLDATTPRAS